MQELQTVKSCSLIATVTTPIPFPLCTGGKCQEEQKPLGTCKNILIMKVTGDITFPLCIQLGEVTKTRFRRDVNMKEAVVISSRGFSLAPTALLQYC